MSTTNSAHLEIPTHRSTLEAARRCAWLGMFIADAGLLIWGAMAALAPEHLLGPHSTPILEAGYNGFTGGSWDTLAAASPNTTDFMTLLFRMFGIGNIQFAFVATMISATAFRRGERWAWWALLVGNIMGYGAPMTYDRIVGAIGPFEALEYLGIAVVFAALAVTASSALRGSPVPPTEAPR